MPAASAPRDDGAHAVVQRAPVEPPLAGDDEVDVGQAARQTSTSATTAPRAARRAPSSASPKPSPPPAPAPGGPRAARPACVASGGGEQVGRDGAEPERRDGHVRDVPERALEVLRLLRRRAAGPRPRRWRRAARAAAGRRRTRPRSSTPGPAGPGPGRRPAEVVRRHARQPAAAAGQRTGSCRRPGGPARTPPAPTPSAASIPAPASCARALPDADDDAPGAGVAARGRSSVADARGRGAGRVAAVGGDERRGRWPGSTRRRRSGRRVVGHQEHGRRHRLAERRPDGRREQLAAEGRPQRLDEARAAVGQGARTDVVGRGRAPPARRRSRDAAAGRGQRAAEGVGGHQDAHARILAHRRGRGPAERLARPRRTARRLRWEHRREAHPGAAHPGPRTCARRRTDGHGQRAAGRGVRVRRRRGARRRRPVGGPRRVGAAVGPAARGPDVLRRRRRRPAGQGPADRAGRVRRRRRARCTCWSTPGARARAGSSRDHEHLAWVRAMRARVPLVASVCTGALVLAAAGLLAGRPATTHWGAFDELAEIDPSVAADTEARFVDDGDVVTAAGVSAGHRHGAAPGGAAGERRRRARGAPRDPVRPRSPGLTRDLDPGIQGRRAQAPPRSTSSSASASTTRSSSARWTDSFAP